MAAAFPLGVKFFPKVPAVRDMGLELEVGDSLYTNLAGGGATSLNLSTVGTNLYYRTPFNFPLNALLRAGNGLTCSLFNLSSPQQATNGSFLDYYVKVGTAAELDIGKLITFELWAEWLRVLYANANFDSLRFYLRGGVRIGG